MPSSSGRSGLYGPRPNPLKVSKDSLKAGKSPVTGDTCRISAISGSLESPTIVYLDSPKVIHTKPQDFMSLVQRLTGKDSGDCLMTSRSSGSGRLFRRNDEWMPALNLETEKDGKREDKEDPLLLTLGQSPSSTSTLASGSGSSVLSPALFSPSCLKACLQEFTSFL